MAPKSKKMASKTCSKTDAKNDAKINRIWTPNEAKMEPNRHPEINVFLARFLEASGNIGGGVGGASTVTLSPADSPGRPILSKNIVE